MTGTTTAFVFPGQGSQRVGMGRHLLARRPDLLRTYYQDADDILGIPLSTLCWEGPASALRDTAITQPAVFLTSLATLDVLRAEGLEPDAVAGHSLGEYTALVAADALDWRDALRLVRHRGRLMAGVNERIPGGMAAVLGLDLAVVEALCARVSAELGADGGVVEVANDNEPRQVVVSGRRTAVERLRTEAEAAGAVRVIGLDVGAPFHSSLMTDIEEEFAAELDRVALRAPRVPLVSTVTADHVTTADEVAVCLRRQLAGRVRWTEAVRTLTRSGVAAFVEVGPGKVLGGLSRRIAREAEVHGTDDERALSKTLARFGAAPAEVVA